jgi:DNA-binding response OmpR family regulator
MQSDVKVLLVEDDADYAEIYRLRLERDGYDVMVAPDGEAALEMVQRVVPDLVYLDLRMPRLDGFSMLSALRADPATAHVPVVVLTNYDAPELRRQGMELGVLEWLVKADVTPSALAQRTAGLMRAEAEAVAAEAEIRQG